MALPHFALLLCVFAQFASGLTPDIQPFHHHRKVGGDGQLWVGITIVSNAQQNGAVCLDGSPPAYHLLKGFGSGVNNWHLHLEGGAWCESEEKCAERATTSLGGSGHMDTSIPFTGLLNNNYQVNPDFYNWNHVYVRYCDGASFSGDVDQVVSLGSGRVLYYRGVRVFKAIVEELKNKGMGNAAKAFLTGCSAGGLSAIHRCNDFQGLLPGVTVKCLSDGGFFLNAPDSSGSYALYSFYNSVVGTQRLHNTLPTSCISSLDSTKCFFPQYYQAYVGPPLFFVNGAYDFWQLENVVKTTRDQYAPCVNSSAACSQNEVNLMQNLRKQMLWAISDANSRSSTGVFIDSCFSHCQVQGDDKWNLPKINGKSISQAVGDWYFDRATSKYIDCPYPCNPTCVRRLD